LAKNAYTRAHEAGETGRNLNRLFQKAFAGAKQIRTQTGITRGSTSVGNVAVDLAQKIFHDLAPCTVMVVGTGEMSEATAKALHSRGAGAILVCSRTHERAEALAGQLGGQAISYDDWPARFPTVDIVISATAAPHPIITKDKLIPLMKSRRQRPLFLIDIAVPRDAERACGDLDDVYLYDIDDLQQIASENRSAREREITACQVIIDEQVRRFMNWLGEPLTPHQEFRNIPCNT
jgi:glutamyl-tRNA reductase